MNKTKSTPQDELLDLQISHEQIRLLYGSLKFSLGASFVVGIIMYITLSGQTDSQRNLDLWLYIFFTIFFVRTLDAVLFSISSKKTQEKPIWNTRFLIGALSGGILWGLLAWLGQSSKDEYQALIIMCVVGVCAGSLSSLSFSWKALVTFFTPATSLLAINLFISESVFSHKTSIILAFFILFTLMSGKRIYNNTHQNIRLRIEADNREIALELMHQKQLLHSQQTPLAIIEFDLKLHITDWNKAAEKIFGYRRNEAIGKNILSLIVPEKSLPHVEKLWLGVLDLNPVVGDAIETHKKNGDSIICEWYITPLTKHDNEIVGIAAMALDITEKKQVEEDLVNAKNESERANQAKSDFLSIMSHELRTPLNSILGFTQLLSVETSLKQKQKSHINEINSAGQLLLELVNQILDLARIEEGYLNLNFDRISAGDVINECNTLVGPMAEQNNISITVECNCNQEHSTTDINNIFVNADYTRLKQVLLNLITNAIKYNSDDGNVIINCQIIQNNLLRINVIDTGNGIPEDDQKDIFEPFKRLVTGSSIEGTGIGLSISKQLIEKMHGRIGVESRYGNGSTFWIEIERSMSDSQSENGPKKHIKPKVENNLIDNEDKQSINILVAEDNPINQTLILNQLETLGYTADLVTNGQEALQQLGKLKYNLLFTDCNMPIMDGYELSRTIRKNGDSSLSIIAITADAFPERKEQCLQAGMNDRITKPVSLEDLQRAISLQLS